MFSSRRHFWAPKIKCTTQVAQECDDPTRVASTQIRNSSKLLRKPKRDSPMKWWSMAMELADNQDIYLFHLKDEIWKFGIWNADEINESWKLCIFIWVVFVVYLHDLDETSFQNQNLQSFSGQCSSFTKRSVIPRLIAGLIKFIKGNQWSINLISPLFRVVELALNQSQTLETICGFVSKIFQTYIGNKSATLPY